MKYNSFLLLPALLTCGILIGLASGHIPEEDINQPTIEDILTENTETSLEGTLLEEDNGDVVTRYMIQTNDTEDLAPRCMPSKGCGVKGVATRERVDVKVSQIVGRPDLQETCFNINGLLRDNGACIRVSFTSSGVLLQISYQQRIIYNTIISQIRKLRDCIHVTTMDNPILNFCVKLKHQEWYMNGFKACLYVHFTEKFFVDNEIKLYCFDLEKQGNVLPSPDYRPVKVPRPDPVPFYPYPSPYHIDYPCAQTGNQNRNCGGNQNDFREYHTPQSSINF